MSTQQQAGSAGEKKRRSRQNILGVAIPVVALICIPYVYMAIQINAFGQANKPEGYLFPEYVMLWKTVAGALFLQAFRKVFCYFLFPQVLRISKGEDDLELREKHAHVATQNLYQFVFFVCSCYWGWYCLKDTPWLPWYLGGQAGGDFRAVEWKTIFTSYEPGLLDYSLYTFSYHFGNLMQHIFVDERTNDFEEMLLHHIATCSLYFCFIFGN